MTGDTCFLDTNVLLRFFANDEPTQSQNARALIERLERADLVAETSHAVIFEVAHTLRSFYGVDRAGVQAAMKFIVSLPGLELAERDIFVRAFDLYVERNISLVDAFNAEYMRTNHITCVFSWDRDFDKLPWVSRREPI